MQTMTAPRVDQARLVNDQVIGDRVHQLMWRKRISQTKLAPMLGLTQSGLSGKIHGKRPWFATELVVLAEVLGTTVNVLCMPLSGVADGVLEVMAEDVGRANARLAERPAHYNVETGTAPAAEAAEAVTVRRQGLEPRTR